MRYNSRSAALLLLLLSWILAGCALERPAPVLKVGLLGPFEGERRELGYHLLPAIRAATPERVRGSRVEWVILDTHGDPATAAARARELAVDPAVLAVVGPLLPAEVAAVAPVMEEAEMAWWPLAPSGAEGLAAWAAPQAEGLPASQQWGPLAWPALRRGDAALYLDPQLPAILGDFGAVGGAQPWPQDWLAWEATRRAFDALTGAGVLDRASVRDVATRLPLPPPARYRSVAGAFPGILED